MLRHEWQNKNAAFSDEKPQFQHTEELLLSQDSEQNALPENGSIVKGLAGEGGGCRDSRVKLVCGLVANVASGLNRRVDEEEG